MTDADNGLVRCAWVGTDPAMIAYHDDEWGTPCHDDRALFERLMLECFQAGLSWATILRKRDNFARAFAAWDPVAVAAFGDADVARLLADPGIVRNRLKIAAAIRNARAFLAIQQEFGAFAAYLQTAADPPHPEPPASPADIPSRTSASDALAKELKRRGFTFVGSTICYSFMQSVGIVNDHLRDCFRSGSSRQ